MKVTFERTNYPFYDAIQEKPEFTSEQLCIGVACRSKQIFGGAKDFFPNFSELAQNVFVQLLPTNIRTPTKIMKTFLGVTSKKRFSFLVLQMLGVIF